MNKIFLTSDLHFGHNKEFIWKERGFNSIAEMNEKIIENWNNVVDENDTVYLLGDIMLGDSTEGVQNLQRLKGNIIIIAGNHDTDTRIKLYEEAGYPVYWAYRLRYRKYNFFLSHFPAKTGNFEEEKTSLRQYTCNLFGHMHQKENFFNDIPFMYHVGVDSHNCTPVLLDDIIEEMEQKFIEMEY